MRASLQISLMKALQLLLKIIFKVRFKIPCAPDKKIGISLANFYLVIVVLSKR